MAKKKRLFGAKRKSDTVVKNAFGQVKVSLAAMVALKTYLDKNVPKVYDATCKEHNIDPAGNKGNYKIFDENEDLRIEVSEQTTIAFDDILMAEAKVLFDDFIDSKLTGDAMVVAPMVKEAFQAKQGQLDSRKILYLLKFRRDIADESFQKGCDLIQAAQRRTQSKRFYRFGVRNEEGEYISVSLNFSHISNDTLNDLSEHYEKKQRK